MQEARRKRESRSLLEIICNEDMLAEIAKQYYLTTDEWVEILLRPVAMEKFDAVQYAIDTIEEAGIKFYANLTRDGTIMVKKQIGEVVIGTIQNVISLQYFKSNFKPIV